jgi:cytochrome o ubiquinol oxidase operon protein cyoD
MINTWSYKPLIWGLILSLILTLAAYLLAIEGKTTLIGAILGLGFIQALIQLVCFLHVGIESKPHWNLFLFLFMAFIAFIIVGGSIWIMSNLDYNVMPAMTS